MVHAWVAIAGGEDAGTFAEAEVSVAFERVELPADEAVLERVAGSGDHGPAPVDVEAQPLQICHAQRWELLQPAIGFRELVDLSLGNPHLKQDLLPGRVALGVMQALGWDGLPVSQGVALFLQFASEAVSGGIDGCARAVEAEGPEHVEALQAFEACCELILGGTEAMA